MSYIDEFKKIVKKDLSTLVVSDLDDVIDDENFEKLISEPESGLEIADFMLEHNKDEIILSNFLSIKNHLEFMVSQKKIGSLFRNYDNNNDLDLLSKAIIGVLKSDNCFDVICMSVAVASTLDEEEFNLEEYLEIIKTNCEKVVEILEKLNVEISIPIMTDLTDILYTAQQFIYEKYSIDIIENLKDRLGEVLSKINKFSEELDNILMDIDPSLRPEQLGLIDITQFDDNGGDE